MTFEFIRYDDSRSVPNVVVDGSPNEATVLTLTHWPGIAQPPGMGDDLSAQMAFRYLDEPPPHPAADAVTNNHFDQDGLVSAFALLEPETALGHRALLIDLAAAGDFGTYTDRRAARASMVISRIADRPFDDYDRFCAECYHQALPLVMPMLLDGDRFRDDWGDEDAELTRSERAMTDGVVEVTERADLDLAIAVADARWEPASGHRFGGRRFDGIHPMAINNATACTRLLFAHDRRYTYTDRYETWVQLQSRRPPARVDLRPLADELTGLERGTAVWSAQAPGELTPTLGHTDESSLDRDAVVTTITRRLSTAPPAWDPFDHNR